MDFLAAEIAKKRKETAEVKSKLGGGKKRFFRRRELQAATATDESSTPKKQKQVEAPESPAAEAPKVEDVVGKLLAQLKGVSTAEIKRRLRDLDEPIT